MQNFFDVFLTLHKEATQLALALFGKAELRQNGIFTATLLGKPLCKPGGEGPRLGPRGTGTCCLEDFLRGASFLGSGPLFQLAQVQEPIFVSVVWLVLEMMAMAFSLLPYQKIHFLVYANNCKISPGITG